MFSYLFQTRDLEKWFNLLSMRTSLQNISVDKKIADRYYQEAAIKAVCRVLMKRIGEKPCLLWPQVPEKPEQ